MQKNYFQLQCIDNESKVIKNQIQNEYLSLLNLSRHTGQERSLDSIEHFVCLEEEKQERQKGKEGDKLTFGSMGLIYRPLSSEHITFFALPALPRRLCACCAKKRSFSSTKPPSASKINSSGICSCCSFSLSFSS